MRLWNSAGAVTDSLCEPLAISGNSAGIGLGTKQIPGHTAREWRSWAWDLEIQLLSPPRPCPERSSPSVSCLRAPVQDTPPAMAAI